VSCGCVMCLRECVCVREGVFVCVCVCMWKREHVCLLLRVRASFECVCSRRLLSFHCVCA